MDYQVTLDSRERRELKVPPDLMVGLEELALLDQEVNLAFLVDPVDQDRLELQEDQDFLVVRDSVDHREIQARKGQ